MKKNRGRFRLGYHDIYKTIEREDIHKDTFLLVNKIFFILLSKSMIQKGNIYKLPYRLGYTYIGKRRSGKKKILDYAHYKKTGEMIFRKTSQADNYIAFFNWDKKGQVANWSFKNTIKFTPVRSNKKELTKAIRQNNTMGLYKPCGI